MAQSLFGNSLALVSQAVAPQPPRSTVYVVAKEFSRFPGGRRRVHGPYSGEEFREAVVLDLLERFDRVTFDLSGSAGYSSGFLDEAFGELGALYPVDELKRRLTILASDDPGAVDIAWSRIQDASRERKRK